MGAKLYLIIFRRHISAGLISLSGSIVLALSPPIGILVWVLISP